MINKYIAAYKKHDENSDDAFQKIYNMCKPYVNSMARKYPIIGKDINDFHFFAMEQILDCLNERKLKRGTGVKKVLSENDDAKKNFNYLIAAIKYKFVRERRKTESNVKYSFNMPILDENGEKYLDRNNKPLDIGINFVHNIPYLYEGKKKLNLILNLPVIKNKRTVVSYDYSDPIDGAISYDFRANDDESELSNLLDHEFYKNNRDTSFDMLDLNNIPNIIRKNLNIDDKQLNTIKGVIDNSYSVNALKQYVKENKKDVYKIKKHLRFGLKKIGIII